MADNIREAIMDRMEHTTEVAAITTTIRPGVLAELDVPPCILVKVIADTPLDGITESNRTHRARIAVQAYGDNTRASDALAKTIREKALHSMLKGTVEGMNIREVTLEAGPFDDEDQPKDGSDDWMRHVRQDFIVYYNP